MQKTKSQMFNENIEQNSSKCRTISKAEVGTQIKNFNAQAQIARPKILIGKTQILQVKNKIGKVHVQENR